jgi:hypothetical protein
MPRSDGKYPHYVKLDVDPHNPPDGWDEGCRRCIVCKKNWPNIAVFSPSPCCNQQAGIVADGMPDVNWKEAVHYLLHSKFDKFYERWNEEATDEELRWISVEDFPVSEQEMNEGMQEIEALIADVEGRNARHS